MFSLSPFLVLYLSLFLFTLSRTLWQEPKKTTRRSNPSLSLSLSLFFYSLGLFVRPLCSSAHFSLVPLARSHACFSSFLSVSFLPEPKSAFFCTRLPCQNPFSRSDVPKQITLFVYIRVYALRMALILRAWIMNVYRSCILNEKQ